MIKALFLMLVLYFGNETASYYKPEFRGRSGDYIEVNWRTCDGGTCSPWGQPVVSGTFHTKLEVVGEVTCDEGKETRHFERKEKTWNSVDVGMIGIQTSCGHVFLEFVEVDEP